MTTSFTALLTRPLPNCILYSPPNPHAIPRSDCGSRACATLHSPRSPRARRTHAGDSPLSISMLTSAGLHVHFDGTPTPSSYCAPMHCIQSIVPIAWLSGPELTTAGPMPYPNSGSTNAHHTLRARWSSAHDEHQAAVPLFFWFFYLASDLPFDHGLPEKTSQGRAAPLNHLQPVLLPDWQASPSLPLPPAPQPPLCESAGAQPPPRLSAGAPGFAVFLRGCPLSRFRLTESQVIAVRSDWLTRAGQRAKRLGCQPIRLQRNWPAGGLMTGQPRRLLFARTSGGKLLRKLPPHLSSRCV
jgi:hypothetical protein